MQCPKCKKQLNNATQYCSNCGQKINNSHIDQYTYSELYSNILKPKITSDEDYIRNYIGNDYDNIKKESYSLRGFILGPIDLLLKKVYTPAILILLIIICLYNFDKDIAAITYVICSLYIGIKGNSIYLQHATRKCEEIKISNPDKSSTEILELCKKEGKNHTIWIILLPLIILLTMYITKFVYTNQRTYTTYNIKEEILKEKHSIKNMNYEIDNVFENEISTVNYEKYNYKDNNNNCRIKVVAEKYTTIYASIDDYISKNIYIPNNAILINNRIEQINNINYRIKEIQTDSSNKKLILTVYNDNIYYVEYIKKNSYQNDYCDKAINELTKSIEINV